MPERVRFLGDLSVSAVPLPSLRAVSRLEAYLGPPSESANPCTQLEHEMRSISCSPSSIPSSTPLYDQYGQQHSNSQTLGDISYCLLQVLFLVSQCRQ
jgi:hypothetical protein